MTEITKEDIQNILNKIKAPGSKKTVLEVVSLDGIDISNNIATVILKAPNLNSEAWEPLRQEVERTLLKKVKGLKQSRVILTADKEASPTKSIKYIIAVASGKGGVGKSTVATNLALSFKKQGLDVGVLDADIYGPSQPTLLGVSGQPEMTDDKKILPVEAYGIKLMSMGFFMDDDTPVIWRGPMLHGALKQMLEDVMWGALDVLIIDMPPGTGDVAITLSQKADLSGVVIVSTPQDLALLDAKKAISMFKKINIPILGLVENMSQFVCPECGHEENIFGHGGTEKEALRLGAPFLGALPLNMDIRIASDEGKPIVSELEHKVTQKFDVISKQVLGLLNIEKAA